MHFAVDRVCRRAAVHATHLPAPLSRANPGSLWRCAHAVCDCARRVLQTCLPETEQVFTGTTAGGDWREKERVGIEDGGGGGQVEGGIEKE